MFHFLVKASGWAEGQDSLPRNRVFEYTDLQLYDQFQPSGQLDVPRVNTLPALFLSETPGGGDQRARVGTITNTRLSREQQILDYAYDSTIPPIPNSELQRMATALDIQPFQFARTHWSIKDVDLFKVLLQNRPPARQRPNVFTLADPETVERDLVAVMMPFHPRFDPVYAALQTTAASLHLRCLRADDIWRNDIIIQDIVSLIDRARTVICDCTERNANVFYETGIAHTLGREVILITQTPGDIPFNLHHLRHIQYLNNNEGLNDLGNRITSRLQGSTA